MRKDSKLSQSLQKLSADLKPMTWLKRIEHIWAYYRIHMLFAGVFLLVIIIVTSSLINLNKKVTVSGVLANVPITDEGFYYLSAEYAQARGVKAEEITLFETGFSDGKDSLDLTGDFNAQMTVIAMVNSRSLDYLLMDKTAMKAFVAYDIFMDLRDILTAGELEAWEECLMYAQPEGEERYPIAVDISGTPFGLSCLQGKKDIYIAFAGNTTRPEACRHIWEYLLLWET